MPTGSPRTENRDSVVVVVMEADPRMRETLRTRLEPAPAAATEVPGSGDPRYRVRFAHDCDEAERLATAEVTALVLNLSAGKASCVRLIEQLRLARPDVAILCYVTSAPRADAMAAIIAGADHVMEFGDGSGVDRALDLALDRRWLAVLIERSASDIEEARQRLARMGGNASVVLPGLRPPAAANAVLPFHEAARRYLLACAKLFEGDARGLADRLGVSYFALRRLLKRYGVPFPGRTQRNRKPR